MLIELAFKEMVSDKKFQGLTENSLTSYDSLWSTFSRFLIEEGIERVDDLSPRLFKKFLQWCEAVQGNSAITINTKLKLLRSFARWLHEEGITNDYTCKNIKTVKTDTNPRIVHESDIRKALSYLRRVKRREDDFYSYRNHSILVFLIGTGLRASELCRLEWSHIDFNDQLITLNKTKSRTSQSVPLSETVLKELLAWKDYAQRFFNGKLPASLFCTRDKKPLTRNGLRLMFDRLRESWYRWHFLCSLYEECFY